MARYVRKVERSDTPAKVIERRLKGIETEAKETAEEGLKELRQSWKRRRRWMKWLVWLVVAVVLYFTYSWLLSNAEALLQQSDTLWSTYSAVKREVAARSLLGLFYISFFGALFFLPLPVEGVFLYYLSTTDHSATLLIVMALAGNLLGIAVDYLIGWAIGPRVLQWFMKERYEKFANGLNRAGSFLVIVGNIIPFPIEPLTLVLGATRYGFVRLMIWSAIGKIIKFLALYFGLEYFVTHISPRLSEFGLFDVLRAPFS